MSITDVSALGAVPRLDLDFCGRLTGASALGGVHVLRFSNCDGAVDMSTLGGHTLDLDSGNEKLGDVQLSTMSRNSILAFAGAWWRWPTLRVWAWVVPGCATTAPLSVACTSK